MASGFWSASTRFSAVCLYDGAESRAASFPTRLMIVATTSAASLSAGQALNGLQGSERENSLFLMVVLIGALQILFGLLGFGRLTRFVSFSVMTGFIIGIAGLTILSQVPTITGFEATSGSNNVTKASACWSMSDKINPSTVAVSSSRSHLLSRCLLPSRQFRQTCGHYHSIRAGLAFIWKVCRSSGLGEFRGAYRCSPSRAFRHFA